MIEFRRDELMACCNVVIAAIGDTFVFAAEGAWQIATLQRIRPGAGASQFPRYSLGYTAC